MNEKINELKGVYLAKYATNLHPEVAATYALHDFMNIAKNQMEYFEQLVDEEIDYVRGSLA